MHSIVLLDRCLGDDLEEERVVSIGLVEKRGRIEPHAHDRGFGR